MTASQIPYHHHSGDEEKWVKQIRYFLDEVSEEDDGITVSIFNVPKPLLRIKPEAFVPQLISIGPYHYHKPELLEMEKYKISIAKGIQKQLHPDVKFQQVVTSIKKVERRIRANYHRHINFQGETLGWMMAIDGCFLLEYLHVYAVEDRPRVTADRYLKRISSRMSHLLDSTGRKSGHNAVLRDIMMLENQIPLFVLGNILDLKYPLSTSERDHAFDRILTGSMKELCPFKMMDGFPPITVSKDSKHPHLLALLYYIIVPSSEDLPVVEGYSDDGSEDKPGAAPLEFHDIETGLKGEPEHVRQLCGTIWVMVSRLKVIKRSIAGPLKALVNIPWKLLGVIPGFSLIRKPVELFFSNYDDDCSDSKDHGNDDNTPPSVDEITIPSVEELIDAGVRFRPTKGDLTTISFDYDTAIFHLPAITLDINTESILRNLVAYETSVSSGPLVFTRYTELMNGIIDTEEDVRLLRNKMIIENRMKNDKEVADVWNGMSRSVRLTKVPFMDKVIRDVNRYRDSSRKVRIKRFMNKYVFGSWPLLTFLAAILLIFLNGLQAICSVYSCSTWTDSIT